jgi:preprotein translocase subunit SecG
LRSIYLPGLSLRQPSDLFSRRCAAAAARSENGMARRLILLGIGFAVAVFALACVAKKEATPVSGQRPVAPRIEAEPAPAFAPAAGDARAAKAAPAPRVPATDTAVRRAAGRTHAGQQGRAAEVANAARAERRRDRRQLATVKLR